MQSNSDNAEVPVLGVFQFDANTVSQGVNLFRGNLAFPLKLLSLPGGGGLTFELTILYQSSVDIAAGTWNLVAPTSPLGLGWSMPQDQIIADPRSSGSQYDDDYYLISGGQTSHLNAIPAQWSRQGGTLPSNARAYEASGNPFWSVVFYPDDNKWIVIREDGTVSTYGGTGTVISGNASANVLTYGIQWNNWIGPSRMPTNQQRFVRGWNLARIENTAGNYMIFNYEVTEQAVGDGALTYTKESHLKTVENDLGWTVNFGYLPMTYDSSSLTAPKEYLDPHGDPSIPPSTNRPNAWQSQYNTRFLNQVIVKNSDADAQVTLQFNYDRLQNLTELDPNNALGYGTTYKRFLIGIDEIWASGSQKPGVEFEYIYSTSTTQNRGALRKITYPTGGSTDVTYDSVSIGASTSDDPGSRNITIDNPFGTGTNGASRTWYGPDYVVNAWYSSTQQMLMLNVYTWIGRWYPAQTTWWQISGAVNIDSLQAATGTETFALAVPASGSKTTNVYLFNREPQAYATWTPQGGGATPVAIPYATASLTIATGDDFYVLVDNTNSVVDRYAWNWMTQDWDIAHLAGSTLCSGSSGQYNYYATAGVNYHFVVCYDRQQNATRFTLMYRNPLLQWQTGSQFDTSAINLANLDGFSYIGFGPSSSFVSLAWITGFNVTGNVLVSFNYSGNVLQWDANYQNLAFAQLPNTPPTGFTNVPVGVMNSIGPNIIDNTLVASGPNLFLFDGSQWTYQFIGIQYPAGTGSDPQQQYYWYGYATDTAIKTENTDAGVYSTVTGIDLNNPSPGWQTQILTNQSPPPPSRQTQFYPTLAAEHLTQGVNLYSRSVYTNWINIQNYLLTSLTGSLDTTTMIDQPPFFVAWSSTDNTGKPLAANLVTFHNGNLVRTPQGFPVIQTIDGQQMFSLFDRQQRYQTALSGKLPAVPLGFVTFPTTATLDATPSIALHRYANGGVTGAITTFVVSTLVTDNGYFTQSRCYQYEQITASSDDSGTIVRFNKVASFDACATPSQQKYGYTVSYFFNGLPPGAADVNTFDSADSAASVYSVLDGMLIRQEQWDVDHNMVSDVENRWTAATQVSTDAAGANLRNIWGGIPRITQTTKQLDGVRRTTVYDYSNASGAPLLATNTYYNSAGQLITREIATTFAYEEYPSMWRANILQPAAQTETRVSADGGAQQIAPIIVQTAKLWNGENGTQYWAEWQSWIPITSTAPQFTQWNGGDPGAQWRLTEQIQQRTVLGQPVLSVDVQGRPVTIFYDDENRLPIATFVNATTAANGVSYDSFESYQASTWSAPPGASVISTDSFTGTNCMQLTAGGTLQKNVTVASASGSYVFALWYKTPSGGVTASLAISAQGGTTLTFPLPPTNGAWQNAQWVADLAGLNLSGAATLSLQITAAITSGALLVDDVVFTPVLSIFNASVYDMPNLFRTAQLALNANVERRFRNLIGGVAGQTGAWDNPTGFTTSFLSTQLASAFQPNTPNARFNVSARDQGFYDQFKAGALSSYTFINSSASNWSVANEELQLVTGSSAPLGAQVSRSGFSSPSIGIYVLVGTTSANTVSIGTGTYFALWNGSQWQLVQQSGGNLTTLATNTSVPFGNEWIFCAFDDRILFLCDGAQVFSYSNPGVAGNQGVQLGMKQPGNFSTLLVCETIAVQMTFSDGLGRPTQTIGAESGDSVLMTASLYDDRGNAAIEVKQSRVTSSQVANPFAYYPNYVTNAQPGSSLWSGAPMTGPAVTIYHPDDGGYPFTRKVGESSPLARLLQTGKPGIDFAITAAGNPHIQTYAYGTNSDPGSFLYPLPANQYLLVTGTDPNGNVTVTWTDTEQNQVGITVQPPGGGSTWANSMVHNTLAQPIASIPPAYYASNPPQSPSNPIPPSATQMTFDYLGQRSSASNPNLGTSNYLYDKAGQPRFMQDPAAAAAGVIRYIKYDALNRMVEDGYYAAAWDPAALAPYLDDNTWPPATTTWSVRRTFDGNASTPNMVGRLWQSFANSAAQADPDFTETYQRDVAGNVTQQTRQVTAYQSGQTFTFQQSFDRAGTILSTSDATTNLTIANAYNSLGQLTNVTGAVGGGSATALLQYTYTQEGKLNTVAVGNNALTRDFSYNSPDWITETSDSAMNETLTYTTGSCGASGYWNGNVASQSEQLGGSPAQSECFTLDSLDRIVQAGTGASQITWQIDDNGNFQTVVDAGVTRTFTYNPGTDQLQSVASSDNSYDRSYLYNSSGNVSTISQGSTQLASLTYSPAMNLVQNVTTPSSAIAYQYDAAGDRTLKTVTGANASQTFLFPIASALLQITSGTAVRYALMPGVRIAFANGTYYFGLTDHLGSTRALVTIDGSVVAQWAYDVYGAPTIVQAPPIPYGALFTGMPYDATLGLYEFPARLYDPILGRFLAIDPKLQQPSPYVYAGDNPMIMIDPTGMAAWYWWLAAIVVGAIVAIGTGGLGAAFVGGGIGAAMAVGAVAGAAGTLASDAIMAYADGQAFTWQRALIDIVGGAIGGAAGAGVGGAVGSAVSSRMLNAGFSAGKITVTNSLASGISGGIAGAVAQSGAVSVMTGEPFFSKATALNIVMGAVTGMGAGAMAARAHFNWLTGADALQTVPVLIKPSEFGGIQSEIQPLPGNRRVLLNIPNERAGGQGQIRDAMIAEGRTPADAVDPVEQALWISQVRDETGAVLANADVTISHGVGGHVIVEWQHPVTNELMYRPMTASTYAEYLQLWGFGTHPVKLVSCFGSSGWKFWSVASTLQDVLGQRVYGHWKPMYPVHQGPWGVYG